MLQQEKMSREIWTAKKFHSKLVILGIAINVVFFVCNINSYFTLTTVNLQSKKYQAFVQAEEVDILSLQSELVNCRNNLNEEPESNHERNSFPEEVPSDNELTGDVYKNLNESPRNQKTNTSTVELPPSIDSELEHKQEEAIIEQWEQQKDDKNIFYSIFANVEQWPKITETRSIQRRILVHVNSRNILTEVASDVRMMHR